MKVYLVTRGSYSEYSVLGVYSTKKIAKRAMELYLDEGSYMNGLNDLEEFELDALPAHSPGVLPYSVRMGRDGGVISCERRSVEYASDGWRPYGDNVTVRFDVFAKDKEHAVKIANERRAGVIASGQWTTDFTEWQRRNGLLR